MDLKRTQTSLDPAAINRKDSVSHQPFAPARAATNLGLVGDQNHELAITTADDLEYFAEGKSNVLYRYIGEAEALKPRLFRFRKQQTGSRTIKEVRESLQRTFVPLLSSYVVQTDLCSVGHGVIKSLNSKLRRDGGDHTSHGKAGGGYFVSNPMEQDHRKDGDMLDESEEYALAVEDMSPGIYQKHNEIAHNRSIRRRRQFPFLNSPRQSSANLVHSGENSEANSGYNTENENDDNDDFLLEEDEEGRVHQHKVKERLPIPNKRDLDPARLSARNWRDLLTVRFRPGCLVTPDTAPKGWSVCRDCATRNMDAASSPPAGHVHHHTDSGLSDCSEESTMPEYCPFDLISRTPSRVHTAIESIIAQSNTVKILDEEEVVVNDPALGIHGITPWLDVLEYSIVNILADYFWDEGSIGHVLRELQGREDVAAALRSATLFVRLWMRCKEQENYEVHIECKVGGLERNPEVEAAQALVEKELIRGGWYLGRGATGPICRRE